VVPIPRKLLVLGNKFDKEKVDDGDEASVVSDVDLLSSVETDFTSERG
jgi:hypothetical protein